MVVDKEVGTLTWTVNALSAHGLDTVYTVEESINAIRTALNALIPPYSSTPDTTFISNAMSAFTITDSPGNALSFQYIDSVSLTAWLLLRFNNYGSLMRYIPADSLHDSKYIYISYGNPGPDTVVVSRSVGMTSVHLNDGVMIQDEFQALLTAYQLK
jgi:hypothetical protein